MKGAVQDVYKRVAPATVIVRAGPGYGSGVIYDPAGWILTNHHVVAHARRKDFRWKVKISLGKLNKQGAMEKRGKLLDAYVHKVDPLLDLAVVKLVNPPKDLSAVAISPKDPAPGEAVSAVGHAGIGLVWAIKDGQIAAVGKLSTHLANLMLYEEEKKSKRDGGEEDPRMQKFAKRRAAMLEKYKKHLQQKKPALVIQSTCDISQGDSGGPLVNRQGEVVGLNAFVRSVRVARKESNFHIHVKEIRKFIKEVPKEAPQIVPDPWAEGGAVAELGDADLDATVDVLVLYKLKRRMFFGRVFTRRRPNAYFIDLDQDSFANKSLPKVADIVKDRRFDAELIYLPHGRHINAWYDTNNDGKHDVLLVASAYSKRVLGGYRLDAKGKLTRDESLKAGPLIRPGLFSGAALGQRLLAIGSKVFYFRLMPAKARTSRTTYPHPINGAGHEGTLRDLNNNGRPDTIVARGMFSSGQIVDVDEDSIGTFKSGDKLRDVRKSHRIDAEFSWISHRHARWAWYDTNNDGKFDLLLHAANRPFTTVHDAWRVDAAGKYVAEPAQVGRLMVQPELVSGQAEALRRLVRRVAPSGAVAGGAGIKAFPDPNGYHPFRAKLKGVKGYRAIAVEARGRRCKYLLVDLDRDSQKRARKSKTTIEKLARARKFDAELARVTCYRDSWTYYDTKGKGHYDLVLYSPRTARGKPKVAYELGKRGSIKARAKPVACDGLVHPRLFRKARLRKMLSRVGAELFGSMPDPKCRP